MQIATEATPAAVIDPVGGLRTEYPHPRTKSHPGARVR
jgi:hypothetical protein